jgi:hypothetical protein
LARPFKLGHLTGDIWTEFSHPPHYDFQTLSNGTERVRVGVPGADTLVVKTLAAVIEPPFYLLYVPTIPRGQGEPGRYQSPQLTREEVEGFLARFIDYLSSDGRFELWIHSPSDNATIVWEKHNLIYAYGPQEQFVSALRAIGFTQGELTLDFPHTHYYRPEFDKDAAAALEFFEWNRTPLQPGDED